MNICQTTAWNQVQTTLKFVKNSCFQYSQKDLIWSEIMVVDNINISESQNQCLAHIGQKTMP